MTPDKLHSFFWDGCLPVDVLKVARAVGFYTAHSSGEQVVVKTHHRSSSRIEMIVGKDPTPHRQRWAVAHAMGRVYRGDNLPFTTHLDDFDSGNKDMAHANRFAADLLMPKKTLLYVIGRGTTDVDELADIFGVSSVAMAYQLSHTILKGVQ